MLAMQYSITLPADYDMAIIRRRITDKGHLLDHFPRLRFKAYLYADRRAARLPTRHNLYAPFYLWDDAEGMNAFLGSSGFAGVTQAFGWPEVRTWSVWQGDVSPDAAQAVCASCDVAPIAPYADLDELREREAERTRADLADGALAAVSAFEPTVWTLVRLRLWGELRPELAREGRQLYQVGHVSLPRHTLSVPATA
ncbi:DUF4865 family protein [Dyella sp. BiH032]|uniref:DUF4865 family protein n=1 Tax=Dyella sp. BiH032 TaxID=3075430 RepID=UPI0028931EFB|nr:DUF4865 family protein [Dyella sp. BiH032]WNL46703.1 DUF4865 family protein [Dyella sp. BiH032]